MIIIQKIINKKNNFFKILSQYAYLNSFFLFLFNKFKFSLINYSLYAI